jgi:dual-specificity kinase
MIHDFFVVFFTHTTVLHSLRLVHTDLKPENILLVKNDSRLQGPRRAGARSKSILRDTDIRLIDFGSATFENEYHSSVVSTRHYRAPEIILGE